jgi:hypothetical protein
LFSSQEHAINTSGASRSDHVIVEGLKVESLKVEGFKVEGLRAKSAESLNVGDVGMTREDGTPVSARSGREQ